MEVVCPAGDANEAGTPNHFCANSEVFKIKLTINLAHTKTIKKEMQ